MKKITWIIPAMSLVLISFALEAQEKAPSQKHMMREDSAAVNALVMYPDTIRLDIFEACEYPSAIVSIASLQKNSSAQFDSLIGNYSKTEQENFWNLSRYPGLISRLAQEGERSVSRIIIILKDYPAEIHETALEYGTKYFDALQKMDGIQTETDAQFDQILADYPQVTQKALRDLIQFPEVINLLNDHLGLTVRVGDRYRLDPQGVIHKADSLNLAVTRQNAADAEAWKQSIEQDPDDQKELVSAADQYATENGYTQDEIDTPPDPAYVANYTCNPYSYWFGYPTWYPYSYWYPYPYWFDCGFYRDRHGNIIVIGTPSRYFTDWYFYYPEHWNRYPHLCNTYIDHYYERRRSTGGNSSIVHTWVRQRKNYLPPDFVSSPPAKRIEVIRQAARLDLDAQKANKGKPITPAVRAKYLIADKDKFPSLRTPPKVTPERAVVDQSDEIQRPEKQPAVKIFGPVPQPAVARPDYKSDAAQAPAERQVKQEPVRVNKVDQEPAITSRPAPAPSYNFNKIHKAQEYQRNIWEETQPAVRPQQPAPSRQMQQAPARQMQQAPRPQVQQPARSTPAPRSRSKDK